MAWVYLILLAVVIWGACGGVIYAGRRLWSNDTTLRVHMIAAPIVAFLCAALHAAVDGDDPHYHRSRRLCGRAAV